MCMSLEIFEDFPSYTDCFLWHQVDQLKVCFYSGVLFTNYRVQSSLELGSMKQGLGPFLVLSS